jgi:uncharacterized integral membrane protein (TIGR00697 family)
MSMTRKNKLFLVLGGIFITNALLAEMIGGKLFSLEKTLGFQPLNFTIWGDDYDMNLTAGVLLWPVVFILTDVINEYFGKSGVKKLSFLAVGLISYAFLAIWLSIKLTPADFYTTSGESVGISDMNAAFKAVFGQGLWIIVGSLVAFLIGQIVDVTVFKWLRDKTGAKMVWLRATGSTLVSQLIDSFVVLFVAFYIPGKFTFQVVLAIALVNYIYKFVMAVALTPVIYGAHFVIDRYLEGEVPKMDS